MNPPMKFTVKLTFTFKHFIRKCTIHKHIKFVYFSCSSLSHILPTSCPLFRWWVTLQFLVTPHSTVWHFTCQSSFTCKPLVHTCIRYSSKATLHMRIEHMQLIGWKHMVLSTRIGVWGKENLPKLIFKRQECGLKRH